MPDTDHARWVAAHHEAGHAVAMLTGGIYPDGASIAADGSGIVHQFTRPNGWTLILEHPDMRRQQAVIAIAGPVAEFTYRRESPDSRLISGKSPDLSVVAELGFDSDDDRWAIQADAVDILDRHGAAHWWITRLLFDLGALHRDDLVALWDRHRDDN